MKLWQKTYALSALLCTLILYGCMFLVTAPAMSAAVSSTREAACREEKAIAAALQKLLSEVPQGRQGPMAASFLENYRHTGLRFLTKREEQTAYDTLPFSLQLLPGQQGLLRRQGRLYVFVSDRLPSGFELVYLQEAEALSSLLRGQLLTAALTGTAVALMMALALYVLLYRLNLPMSRLAHELRTPLTIMQGYGETLRDARLTPEQAHLAADYIATEAQRLSRVADSLLTLHSPGEESAAMGIVDIEALCAHLQITFPELRCRVNWATAFGDEALLSTLLSNLIKNALAAAPKGSPVELLAEPNRITVTDHGRGLTKREFRYVNHPNRLRRLHREGGIGVPLCHAIAAAHGAKLTYERGEDGGTVAVLTFTTP